MLPTSAPWTSDAAAEVTEAQRGARKQGLRLRRYLTASAFSVLYAVVLALFYTQGRIDAGALVAAYAIVAACIGVFFGLFRLGINLRFGDPSLTGAQFLAAVGTMLFVVYHAPETRIAFTAFFFVALMFGMLRRSGREIAVLGAISVVSFALVCGLRYAIVRDARALGLDMLQFVVMAVTFPWVLFIGGQVAELRRGLVEASTRLGDVEEKAYRDDLTGVYNRRALVLLMENSKRRADAVREPLSLCMIDLDFFKRYNDEFDHLTGDRVLRTFAQAVEAGSRATDFFGRYGGEEFVKILPHTTLAGAVAEADRIRERINALDLPVPRPIGPLTVSIGVAQYKAGEPILETFARADEALYRAKLRGRNRVESL
jgi:diguanylate cyclase